MRRRGERAIDAQKLVGLPLLQAVYIEGLRLRVVDECYEAGYGAFGGRRGGFGKGRGAAGGNRDCAL